MWVSPGPASAAPVKTRSRAHRLSTFLVSGFLELAQSQRRERGRQLYKKGDLPNHKPLSLSSVAVYGLFELRYDSLLNGQL